MSEFQANTAKFCVIGKNVEILNYSRIEADVGATDSIVVSDNSVIAAPGVQHPVNDTDTQTAIADINAVYASLMARTPVTADIAGQTLGGDIPSLGPGIYTALNADLVFRGTGGPTTFKFTTLNPSDKFIIKVTAGDRGAGNVLFDDDLTIECENAARPENVYIVCEGQVETRAVPFFMMNIIALGGFICGHTGGSMDHGFARLFSPSADVSLWYINALSIPSAFCYAKGTLLRTVFGYVPIEDLKEGDEILTHGRLHKGKVVDAPSQYKKVKFIGKMWVQVFSPVTMPVRFMKDSLGPNMPFEDMVVSPNHAIIRDGQSVAAHHFVNGETVVRNECTEIEYYVVQCDDHYVIDANGIKSETLNGNHRTFEPVNEQLKIDNRMDILCN
jgi:hypothetical protein